MTLTTHSKLQKLQVIEHLADPTNAPAACLRITLTPPTSIEWPQPEAPLRLNIQNSLALTDWPNGLPADPNNEHLRLLAQLLVGVVLGIHLPAAEQGRDRKYDPEIVQTLSLMEREPGKFWTIEKLAEASGVSRSTLAQKFKDQVGRTPSDYLLDIRMQLADRHLKTRSHPLKEIARLTGYQSVSAFSTAFKRWCGHSPSARRKSPY
ncbi:helix-turn-helix transcriptional regulator [Planctomicrobium sp. SH661]|uniref:helix-turn-helix transcriptional regulator n=1 Tax=Planctomicrobium sp. SH661 TaxID=3448124 RepID=UPI003F5B6816